LTEVRLLAAVGSTRFVIARAVQRLTEVPELGVGSAQQKHRPCRPVLPSTTGGRVLDRRSPDVERLCDQEYDLCTPIQGLGRFYSFCWPRSIEIIRDSRSGVDTNPTLSAKPRSFTFNNLAGSVGSQWCNEDQIFASAARLDTPNLAHFGHVGSSACGLTPVQAPAAGDLRGVP
jgi:hypothetical protein